MTPFAFATVGLRLMAIYLFYEATTLFVNVALFCAFLNQLPEPSRFFSLVIALSPCVLCLVLSVLLFVFSKQLALRLTPKDSDEVEKSACSFEEVQSIIFAAVGILVLAEALPNLAHALRNLVTFFNEPFRNPHTVNRQTTYDWTYFIGVLAQIILGLLLLLNPRGFRNSWHWLRTAGTTPRIEPK